MRLSIFRILENQLSGRNPTVGRKQNAECAACNDGRLPVAFTMKTRGLFLLRFAEYGMQCIQPIHQLRNPRTPDVHSIVSKPWKVFNVVDGFHEAGIFMDSRTPRNAKTPPRR